LGSFDLSHFYRDKFSKTGLKARCKRCESAKRTSYHREARLREDASGVRTCKTCEITKPVSEFFQTAHRDPSGIPRYRSNCKPCHQAYTNAWRKQHAEELRLRREASKGRRYRKLRLQQYGISEEKLSAMERESNGSCCICLRVSEKLVVDHCHETGKVRALLCPTCNQGLGLFRDDPAAIERAAEYIRQHSE
jgi:hypothetical protein